MSELEAAGSKGLYSQLPSQLVEKAYLENEVHDIRARAQAIGAQAYALETEAGIIEIGLEAYYREAFDVLMNSEGMEHDEFLQAYQTALLNLDRNAPEFKEFEAMMELRTQL